MFGAATPTPSALKGFMTPALAAQMKIQMEIDERNRPLSDEELDSLFPAEGFIILEPPPGYATARRPSQSLLSTPTPMAATPMYSIPTEQAGVKQGLF